MTRRSVPAPAGGTGRPGSAPSRVPAPSAAPGADRRRLWYASAAATVLLIGLIMVLAQVLTGGSQPLRHRQQPTRDARPPLARLCAATSGRSAPPSAVPPDAGPPSGPGRPATGPRTVDPEAGISYAAFGAPWEPWTAVWRAGTLRVPYRVGQHFVTEPAYDGVNDYHASILSAAVPATDNDSLAVDIECVGRQVAADVRAGYYPQPNTADVLRDGRSTLGGRPAWITVFQLHFHADGLRATDELAAVACIDVGRPTAAILYVSIPGTHRQLDWVVDAALASVRVG